MPEDLRAVTGYFFSLGIEGDAEAAGDHLGIDGTNGAMGKLIFYNGNRAKGILTGRTPLGLRKWHSVALVRQGRNVTVYLDGQAIPEMAGEIDVTVPPDGAELFLGGRCDRFANFEGKLDEVAVYDRALLADEIAAHYQAAGGRISVFPKDGRRNSFGARNLFRFTGQRPIRK